MRLPRPRFTLRWLMIAVAVVGVAFGGIIIHGRRNRYLSLAANHARQKDRWQVHATFIEQRAYGKSRWHTT